MSRLEGDLVVATAKAITHGWQIADFPSSERIVLGLTTAPPDVQRAEALCALVGEATGADEVWLADDSVTSHYGALSGAPGVSLVVGTGVACFALPPSGQPRLFDGNGYLLGDDGGAFWIGACALRAVLRLHDGIGQESVLRESAVRRFGPIETMREHVYAQERPVNAIAQFARDVLETATSGDAVAREIIRRAAGELVATALAATAWVGDGDVEIALGGKLLAAESPLRTEFEIRMASSRPGVRIRSADASGLIGALQLGMTGHPERYGQFIHYWRSATQSRR